MSQLTVNSNSSGDGGIRYSGGSWATAQNAASGTAVLDTDTEAYVRSSKVGSDYLIERGFLPFDTSALPDDAVIDSVVLRVYINLQDDTDNDSNAYITVVQSQQASDTALVAADYDQCGDAVDNPTEGIAVGERKDITSISTSAYLEFTLNSTGEGWIDPTGYTLLGLREGHDATDTSVDGSDGATGIGFNTANNASNKPELVITYHVDLTNTLTETIIASDTLETVRSKILTETIAVADTINKGITRTLTETIVVVAKFGRFFTNILTETISVTATIKNYLNGFLGGIWSSISKNTTTWTAEDKPE